MRYSIEPKDRIYVKGCGVLYFTKSMGKNLSNKYSKKLVDSANKSTTDVITASKRAIQKKAEAMGNLIGNKIADKIMSVSKSLKIMKQIMNQKQAVPVQRTYHISRKTTTNY